MNTKSKIFHNLITFCLLLTTLTLLTSMASCTWKRRKPLLSSTHNIQIAGIPDKILVEFEEVIDGKPLNETVWDNVSGHFWDVTESNQIGFTQNYQTSVYPTGVEGTVIPVTKVTQTRIVIPFGRIFSNTFESVISANTAEPYFSYNQNQSKDTQNSLLISDVLKVSIDSFKVWEAPLNHINLTVMGECSYTTGNATIKTIKFSKKLLNQKLGGIFSTHNKFIKEMNRIANNFSEQVVWEILGELFQS